MLEDGWAENKPFTRCQVFFHKGKLLLSTMLKRHSTPAEEFTITTFQELKDNNVLDDIVPIPIWTVTDEIKLQ